MELVSGRFVCGLPHHGFVNLKPFSTPSRALFPSRMLPSLSKSGFVFATRCITESETFGEMPYLVSEHVDEEPNEVTPSKEASSFEEVYDEPVTFENNTVEESSLPSFEVSIGSQLEGFEILTSLKEKLNPQDAYPILLYGSGALLAFWITSAIVGAIDSIPLFPKLFEVVGLGFAVWFSYRYLIFKKNRDELLTKLEELKQEIIGESDA